MITVSDIIRHIEGLSGHPLNKDEGIQHGDENVEVSGVTISWMGTPDAIEATIRNRHELLIVHESLYYPYDVLNSLNPIPGWELWRVNRQRRELLERHGLTCIRIHGSADEICILDTFAELLGLGTPIIDKGLVKVYEIPPCSLEDFIQVVKQRIGMETMRVATAQRERQMVSRVGLPWGGLGLFVNVDYQQQLVEMGCDVFVAGESDNYGFRFAAECGIPMIETSHELSENPGLRRFTDMLAQAFPSVVFRFHENPCIWQVR